MKKFLFLVALIAVSNLASINAWADDIEEDDKIETSDKEEMLPEKKAAWDAEVKKKYNLTDQQMETLRNKGIKGPHMARVARLAELSKKPIDEIIQMRTEQKMGWGKIAKELGIPRKELGHAVSGMRHDLKESKKEMRAERKEARRQERDEKKEQKKSREKGQSH